MPSLLLKQTSIVAFVGLFVGWGFVVQKGVQDLYYRPLCLNYAKHNNLEVKHLQFKTMYEQSKYRSSRYEIIPNHYECVWVKPQYGYFKEERLRLNPQDAPPVAVPLLRLGLQLGGGVVLMLLLWRPLWRRQFQPTKPR